MFIVIRKSTVESLIIKKISSCVVWQLREIFKYGEFPKRMKFGKVQTLIDDNIQIMIWMYVSHKTRISLMILISVLKIPYTSSHHERNVVTESDYLYVPEIWLAGDHQVGSISSSHWSIQVTWHQPSTVTGWKLYEKNESQAELQCQWPNCLVLLVGTRLGLNWQHLPWNRMSFNIHKIQPIGADTHTKYICYSD